MSLTARGGELLPPPPIPLHGSNAPVPDGGRHHLSPVEYFRGLLSMSPAERDRALAYKSPEERQLILAKLREYGALPRAVREARLCQTEFHWELGELMKIGPGQRESRLMEVSVLYRPIIDNLLKQWDKVPSRLQKALLERQGFIGVYLRMQGSSPADQREILQGLSPAGRANWAVELDRWQTLTEKQRSELCAQFQKFCAMSPPQQQQTVDALSAPERQETEKALRAFDRLSPALRAQCIASLHKFSGMTVAERGEFLRNAARWDSMSPHERDLWRQMVHTLPPVPPGFRQDWPGMPHGGPMPPPIPNVTSPVVIAGTGIFTK